MPLTTEGYGGISEAASIDHEKGGKFNSKLVVQYLSCAVTLDLAKTHHHHHLSTTLQHIPYSV